MNETHTDPPPAGATSIPPAARRAANKRFIIPLDTRTILLPDSSISLKQLADFTLPAVKAVTSSAFEPSNTIFFSKEEPSVVNASLISKLRYLPTPDESTVRRLLVEGCKAWVGDSRSVRYAHLGDVIHGEATTFKFPLWVITFWNEVANARSLVTKWAEGKEWLIRQVRQKKSDKICTSAEQALATMDKLPQDSPINANLWRYLDSNWLSNDQINDQLELLQNELPKTHSPPSSSPNASKSSFQSVLIKNVFLTTKIFTAFTRQEQNTYEKESSFDWVRSVANNIIQERKMLVTIVNLQNINGMQHWTPVTIADGGATIFYGDSFGEPIPKKLHGTYTWWIREHGYTGPITVKSLPIGHQTDGSSCGTFAINSLRHFLNPARPLIGGQKASVTSERLDAFNVLSAQIVLRVCEIVQTLSDANPPCSLLWLRQARNQIWTQTHYPCKTRQQFRRQLSSRNSPKMQNLHSSHHRHRHVSIHPVPRPLESDRYTMITPAPQMPAQ